MKLVPSRAAAAVLAVAALLAASPWPASAEGVPFWQRLIRWTSGDSNDTPVPNTLLEPHLQVSICRAQRPGDAERADAVIEAARLVLTRYRDVKDAERAGYKPFFPRGTLGEEVHYTNVWVAGREASKFDLERPGSILYRRTEDGMQAIGVMYSARANASPEELDARLPLSIAMWHRHVNFCGGPDGTPASDLDGPGARFGLTGSIAGEAECAAAGGYWIPLAFGWMTHVYPNHPDPKKVWTGEQMMQVSEAARGP